MSDQQDLFTGIPEDATDDPDYLNMIQQVFDGERERGSFEATPVSRDPVQYKDESGALYVGKEFTLEEFRRWFAVQRLGGLPYNAVGYHHTAVPDAQQWAGLPTLKGIYDYYFGLGWRPWGKGPHLWVYSGDGSYRSGTPLIYVGTHPAHDGYGIVGKNGRWLHIEHIWNGDARPLSPAMVAVSQEVLNIVCARHPFANREIPLTFVRGGVDNPAQPLGVMFHRDQNPSWTPGAWPKSCPGLKVSYEHVLSNTVVPAPCPASPPPAFDGTDKTVNNVVFHAAKQDVESAVDGLRLRRFASTSSCEVGEALGAAKKFRALYWVEGDEVEGERRWWVADDGARVWVGGTVQKPSAVDTGEQPETPPAASVDDTSVVTGVRPRVSREKFQQILRESGSPAADEAGAAWDVVTRENVDPLFALAIFRHESRFGQEGVCASHKTRSPGNTRSSRIGVGEILSTEKGNFVRYPTWTDGWRDLAHRLVDPEYVYVKEGRRAIRQIIERWAPPGDPPNDPASYIRAVVGLMNEWSGAAREPGGEVITPGRDPAKPLNFDPSLVPFPRHRVKLATAKVEGVGMNRLGTRKHLGIVFHRALSGNQTFDDAVDWLRRPSVEGLTDGYVDHRSGEMVLINPMKAMFPGEVPSSWSDMAGWANGPFQHAVASADGRAIVATHGGGLGANVINQNLESMEVTGNYGTPISDACKTMLVQWTASRAQYHKIPWDTFPMKPSDGLTMIYGHREFCGTGFKICPGGVVWEFVNGELISRVRDVLRAAQIESKMFNPTGGEQAFKVNDPVRISAEYNLRRAPTTSEDNIVTILQPGTKATINDGPHAADGYTWWDIKGDFGSGWIVEDGLSRVGDRDGTRGVTPGEATGLPYPPGMDEQVAARLFGKFTGEDGIAYSYSPDEGLSRAWLEAGLARHSFPRLADVWGTDDGRKYFAFADGLVLWYAAEGETVRVLGGAPN